MIVSRLHKIKFSNGTEKCFMCMYVCVYMLYAYMHAQKNINSKAYESDYSRIFSFSK